MVKPALQGGWERSRNEADRPDSAGESGGPGEWTALAPTALDSVPVRMVRWGAAGGVLGAIGRDMADGAHILSETVLQRQLR